MTNRNQPFLWPERNLFVRSPFVLLRPSLDASVLAFFNAMPTALTAAEKTLINNFIVGLKADALWNKIDGGNILCLRTEAQCFIDFKVPSRVATTYVTPSYVFTANRQFMSDGNVDTTNLPASINTGWNPSTAGGNYTDDSGHMAVWRIQSGGTTSARSFAGVNAGNDLLIGARSTSDTMVARINAPTNDTYLGAGVSNNGNGFFLVSRTGDVSSYGQWDATQGSDVATQSTGMPNGNVRVLQLASATAALNTEGCSFISFGGGLSKPEGLLYNSRAQTLITGLRAL